MRRRGAVLGSSVVLTLLAGGLAAPSGYSAPASASQSVIVLLRNQHPEVPATPASTGQRSAAVHPDQDAVRRTIGRLGGTTTATYTTLNAVAARVPASGVGALRSNPAVAAVVPDLVRQLPHAVRQTPEKASGPATPSATPGQICPTDPAKPLLEPEALPLTHTASDDPTAQTARSLGYDGSGVKVAFIADGVDVNQPDFIRADGSHVFVDYRDFSGDGTAAATAGAEALGDAGSIAAQGRVSYDLSTWVNTAHKLPAGCTIRVEGMAPGASLVGLKIFSNALLTAPTSTIIQAIDWAVTVDHVDVINESFGANPYPDTALDPISLFNREAVDAGVTVTASSGDAGGGNTVGTAATDPWVIGVAASTQFQAYLQEPYSGAQLGNGRWVSDQVSGLSSGGITQTGRVPDLMAPGDLGWSLCSDARLPGGALQYQDCTDDNGNPTNLQIFGGTSESAPLAAGAAALVIQAYREAHGGSSPSPDQVRRVLDGSADDLHLPAQDQGAGLLDSYRAVQMAAGINGGTPAGQGLLFGQPYLSRTTAPGAAVTASVTVTNTGVGTQHVTAGLRAIDNMTAQQNQVLRISATKPSATFLDQLGRTRSYINAPLTVPAGTQLLRTAVSWPGPAGPVLRMLLFDPQGTLTGFDIPQGGSVGGNVGNIEIHDPVPGTWRAVIFTAADSTGYTGVFSLRSYDYTARSTGTVSPASFTLPQGGSQVLTVTTTAPATQALASSLVLTGRSATAVAASTLPVVVQAVQPVTAARPATFSGVFRYANGRSYSPGQTDTYRFAVPAGARDLDLTLLLGGVHPNAVVAHLSDPAGEPVDTVQNTRADATVDPGLQIVHANPVAGIWQLTLELLNPVEGSALPQSYQGTVALDQAQVTGSGVPDGATATVSRSRGATATVRIVNTGPAPQTYFLDPRTSATVTYPLVATQAATANPYRARVPLPLQDENVPAWLVPTQSTAITVGATSTAPETFDLMALDNPTALNAPSSPDIESTVSGDTAKVVHTGNPVASVLWAAFPSLIGPFPPGGAAPGSVTMQASVVTRQFDRAVTSSTGDPLLATVDAHPPAATPVTLAPGAALTLTATIRPGAAVGARVNGTLFVDTLQAGGATGVSSYADAIAAVPYSYTVTP